MSQIDPLSIAREFLHWLGSGAEPTAITELFAEDGVGDSRRYHAAQCEPFRLGVPISINLADGTSQFRLSFHAVDVTLINLAASAAGGAPNMRL